MASDDIDALSAREIKQRLTAARVDFSDCFEKRELVKRLRDHCRALDDDKVQEVKALANRCSLRVRNKYHRSRRERGREGERGGREGERKRGEEEQESK